MKTKTFVSFKYEGLTQLVLLEYIFKNCYIYILDPTNMP